MKTYTCSYTVRYGYPDGTWFTFDWDNDTWSTTNPESLASSIKRHWQLIKMALYVEISNLVITDYEPVSK